MSILQEHVSTPQPLGALEKVLNTGTSVWYDINDDRTVRIQVEADASGQLWYVLKGVAYWPSPTDVAWWKARYTGVVSCWCFPHFDGYFDVFAYVPTYLCFATLAELVASEPFADWASVTEWVYDTAIYRQNARDMEESKR